MERNTVGLLVICLFSSRMVNHLQTKQAHNMSHHTFNEVDVWLLKQTMRCRHHTRLTIVDDRPVLNHTVDAAPIIAQ